jgi:hypothetical protein
VDQDSALWRSVVSTKNEPSGYIKLGEFLDELTDC